MADINNVTLAGRLTRDSELKYSGGGLAILRCTLAVNTRKKDAAGEWVDEPNYFDVTIFGKQGEALQSYLLKGRAIAVTGELRQDRWESEGQTRSRVHVVASNIMLLGSGNSTAGAGMKSATEKSHGSSSKAARNAETVVDTFVDDIPF